MLNVSSNQQPRGRGILIIDTNAFIRCTDLYKLSLEYDIYTTNNVLAEIRDRKARDKFLTINYDIITKNCEQKSFNFVVDFSKKTGDYSSLSFADKEIIALGVLIANENQKQHLLRKEPPKMTEYIPQLRNKVDQFDIVNPEQLKTSQTSSTKENIVEPDIKGDNSMEKPEKNIESVTEEKKESLTDQKAEIVEEMKKPEETVQNQPTAVDEKPITDNKLEATSESSEIKSQAKEKSSKHDSDSDDDDDGGGWINAKNISKVFYRAQKSDKSVDKLGVAIMTTDFAMQNVIIQIGIPLLAVDGMVIKQTRKWVLECYACRNICNIPTKEFCPTCGNHTLVKLSVRVNDDGTITYYRNANKKINTRGQIYSIPLPKGGRNAGDLILREDELLMGNKMNQLQRMEKDKEKMFKEAYNGYANGLTFEDFGKQQKYKGQKIEIGYGKINPNDRDAFKRRHKR